MLIKVVSYDPLWQQKFVHEAEKIKNILGELLVDIHHIGSTAVPDLEAKPIIDILPIVTCIESVDLLNTQFEKLGYEWMDEFGIPGRRYLRKGGTNRTHHVHIFSQANPKDIIRHLAVRDYLRSHPMEAKEYGKLKKTLAQKFPNDNDGYCDGKDIFVKELERKAVTWYITAFSERDQ